MQNPEYTISSIQLDYLKLISEHFSEEQKIFRNIDGSLGERFAYIYSLSKKSTLAVSSELGYLSAFDYKVIKFLVELRDFWNQKKDHLIDAIANSSAQYVGGPRHVFNMRTITNQGLFFDTIVFPDEAFRSDPKHFYKSNPEIARVQALSQIAIVTAFEDAVRSTLPHPLVIFCPDFFSVDDDAHIDEVKNLFKITEKTTAAFICSLFGLEKKFEVAKDVIETLYKVDIKELRESFNMQLFKRAYPPFMAETYNNEVLLSIGLNPETFFKILNLDFTHEDVARMAMFIGGQQLHIAQIEANASMYGYDLIVPEEYFGAYKFKNEMLSKEWGKAMPLKEGEVISYAFNVKFKWLKDIQLEEMINIRKDGSLERLRETLRVNQKLLSIAKVQDFGEVVSEYEREVVSQVKKIEKSFEKRMIEQRKNVTKKSLKFSSSLTFAVASFAFPILSPLAIGSTIYSLVNGGTNLREIVNSHLEGRKVKSEFSNRPTGIMLREEIK